jgi:hypothetical protein
MSVQGRFIRISVGRLTYGVPKVLVRRVAIDVGSAFSEDVGTTLLPPGPY